LNCMEPITVSGNENVREVLFEAPKLAVPVGTVAGDQLAAVSKSELPGDKSHVAFCPYAAVAQRPRAAPTRTFRMLLPALTSAVELRLLGRRDRMELLKKRSMTRARTRRNTTSTRDSTESTGKGPDPATAGILLHDQLVAIFADSVRNATVEQSVSPARNGC
jgi:hypothetical protein